MLKLLFFIQNTPINFLDNSNVFTCVTELILLLQTHSRANVRDNYSYKLDGAAESHWLKASDTGAFTLWKSLIFEGRKAGQLTGRNQGTAKVDTDSDRFRA